MQQITKIVQKIGNGGHIYLPREMVGQKVVVSLLEKSIEEIEKEILQILKPYLSNIMGIYLCGSYARGEQTPESDIDILVITDGKVKIKKRINEYEIVSVSSEQIKKTLKHSAVLILPMIKEAKVILNNEIIQKYKKEKLNKENTRWYIETTESSLKLAEDWIREKDIKSMPNIVYPLIMRLRGLYMIECLILDKGYSNHDLDKYLIKNELSADKIKQLNKMYREQRDNKIVSSTSLDYHDISKLYNIVYTYLRKEKSLWAKLN